MKDRVSRNPGAYKAMIPAGSMEALQNSEEFEIFLKRNDDPEEEGTPFNKDSVLPDDVAEAICPKIENPTPADAFRELSITLASCKQIGADTVDRMEKFDGILRSKFESGGFNVSGGVITKGDNPKRIRTVEPIWVTKGTQIGLSDYTNKTLAYYYSSDGTTWSNAVSITSGFNVIAKDEYLHISINHSAAVTDLTSAELLVLVNGENIVDKTATHEDSLSFICNDAGFAYKTLNATAVLENTGVDNLHSKQTFVKPGEKYRIVGSATKNFRPYATTDKDLNIIRRCETNVFDGIVTIEDGEEYLLCNFQPNEWNSFYLIGMLDSLSDVKATASANAVNTGKLMSKNLRPAATTVKTHEGVTYTPQPDGSILANGTATSSSYCSVNNALDGFPNGMHAGGTYYVDFYSAEQKIKLQVSWMDADEQYTYLINNWFGGCFTIPADAVGIRFRYYIDSIPVENVLLDFSVYDVTSVEYAKIRNDRTRYKPYLTIIYDDGHKEFYERILPIIKEKNIPIATAFVPQFLGKATMMTAEELEECFLNGAEVLDHTYEHLHPDIRKTMGVQELQREYLMGRHWLQHKGLNPPCALVFNGATAGFTNCREAAMRVYKAGFNAAVNQINFGGKFDPYFINRYDTDGKALDVLNGWIDNLVSAKTGWMVWMRHNSNASAEDPATAAAILSDAIDYAVANGIEIVTVERGLYEYLGI